MCSGRSYDMYVFHTCTGVDDLLAQHIAHLFVRDPISLFAEKLKQSSDSETDHFEVIALLVLFSNYSF